MTQLKGKWRTHLEGSGFAATFSGQGQPIVHDGVIYQSTGDAKTGKLVWTFYNIPGPGEIGRDTWPADNDAWKYGGAPIWQTPAVDPTLGMIYASELLPEHR